LIQISKVGGIVSLSFLRAICVLHDYFAAFQADVAGKEKRA